MNVTPINSAQRVEAAVTAIKRHGAWLLSMTDLTSDATPDELYDCASGLDKAKKVGKDMALEFGYERPMVWHPHEGSRTWFDLSAYWREP